MDWVGESVKPGTFLSAGERLKRLRGHLSCHSLQTVGCSSTSQHIVRCPFPEISLPDNVTVSQFCLQECDKHPDHAALIDANTGLLYTYGKLKTLVTNLGYSLMQLGFKKGDVFAICSPNSPEYVIVFLAAIQLGGVITTANPENTAYELYGQFVDSGAKWVYTTSVIQEKVGNAATKTGQIRKVIVLGNAHFKNTVAFDDLLQSDATTFRNQCRINVKTDLAILPYSSGTTGKPKGVQLTHYNIVTNVLQAQLQWPFRQENKYLFLVPMFHIYGTFLILGILHSGSACVILPKFHPPDFLNAIQKYKITHVHLVPPIINFLVKSNMPSTYDLSSLQTIYCGAAPLAKEVGDELMKKFPTLKTFQQAWGMTETSPIGTAMPENEAFSGSVGYPVLNTEMKVVDFETGVPLGPNKEGELWLRGPQVMKGYLNNQTATNECIMADGFLRTGDTGYYTQDGHLFIIDRVKELIKYNAYQVAPAELEALLLTHPGVEDVAVIGIPNEKSGEVPKAFVVKKHDRVTEEELIKYSEQRLARYKWIRGGIEFVSEIPKSPSGKILRKFLRLKERSKL